MAHQPRILITAGPTHEPIDAVRYIGNRSSGTLGVALADEATGRGCDTTLLLGPTHKRPNDERVQLVSFTTTADLHALLIAHLPACDILIMAAAVADYRPAAHEVDPEGKRRRKGDAMSIDLEPTPDLLAACAQRRRPDQLLVGFALEPAAELLASARRKLERKSIDLIVANPLGTMDASHIEATLLGTPGTGLAAEGESTGGPIPKAAFAGWLLDRVVPLANRSEKNPPPLARNR